MVRARSSLFLACLPILAVGCGASASDDQTSHDEAAIIGGSASGPEDDATVLLLQDGQPMCTATLVAPNVLLTALHCVAATDDMKVGPAYPAESFTVHVGSKRDAAHPSIAAVGVKIVLPPDATPGVALEGHDLALLLVQSTDSSFDHLKPRQARKAPLATGEKVVAVGWGYVDNATRANGQLPLQRMRRSGVEIFSGSGKRNFVSSTMGGIEFGAANSAGQLIAAGATCQGDSGGPAFDDTGSVAGVTSMGISAVGQGCGNGALTAYTDVSAFRSFIEAGVLVTKDYECLSDAACSASAGRVCNASTQTCVDGCRVGGVSCGAASQCQAPTEVVGVAGTCKKITPPGSSSTPSPTEPSTPGAGDPDPGDSDPGPDPAPVDPVPSNPVGDPQPQCERDTQCAAIVGGPAVCVSGECAPGCRVNAPLEPCGPARVCAGTGADPAVGVCRDAPADDVSALQPPVVTTSPTGVTTNTPNPPSGTAPAPGAPSAPLPPATTGSGAPTPSKKTGNTKPVVDQSGCSVRSGGAAQGNGSAATALLLAITSLRRRRR